MKVASLFIAVVALSSCVAKPWMVGSVNDHYGPPRLQKSDLITEPPANVAELPPVKNPINKTGIHPDK